MCLHRFYIGGLKGWRGHNPRQRVASGRSASLCFSVGRNMTLENLKSRVLAEFSAIGLLSELDLSDSDFRELPTFFEVSHFAMALTVTEEALDVATSIAAHLKSALACQGIELDYMVKAVQHA